MDYSKKYVLIPCILLYTIQEENQETEMSEEEKMIINDLVDLVLLESKIRNYKISHLKLQKLLYYIQAWYLAIYKEPLLNMKFQAWVHGPVNRVVFDRFKDDYGMYDPITEEITNPIELDEKELAHIRNVLEIYLPYSATQLESLTHAEDPWLKARTGLNPYDTSTKELDEEIMKEYYSAQLTD